MTSDCTQWCLFLLQHEVAASVGIVRDKAGGYVLENRWLTSGAVLCIEPRKLIMGKCERLGVSTVSLI